MTDAPDFLDGFAFDSLPAPKPWTSQEIADFITAFEANRKQVFCSPARPEELQNAVRDAGLGAYVTVVASPLLTDDCIIVGESEAQMRARMENWIPRWPA